MIRQFIITADDYGLSRGITDTILETVDHGLVRRVSILANGNDTERALQEYENRKEHLELAIHLNLTEGKSLSIPANIPHLVYTDGRFCHSVGSLWCAYIFATNKTRAELRAEIRRESHAQIGRISEAVGATALSVNSHQHVHLVPFVADTLAEMPEVASLRRVNEPSYIVGTGSLMHFLMRPILRFLSHRASVTAKAGNNWFIGFLYAGYMTAERVKKGLSTIPSGVIEILFHPGSASADEMRNWSTSSRNRAWYSSPYRAREREFLMNSRFKILLDAFSAEV